MNHELSFERSSSGPKQTKIPLGLHRHLLLGIACVVCLLNGPIGMNWQPLLNLLTRSDVYAWRCLDQGLEVGCPSQKSALALLGTLVTAFMFIGSVLGGFVADSFGPRTGLVGGSLMFALHYFTLGISSQKVQLFIPSYILHGLGIEMSFFSMISISNLYPRNQAFALSILGAVRSMAMAYAMLQDAITIPGKFNIRAMAFLCMTVSLGVMVLGWFVLPSKPFIFIKDELEEADPTVFSIEDATVDSTIAVKEVQSFKAKPATSEGFNAFLKVAVKPLFLVWLLYFAIAFARGQFYGISLADQHPRVVKAFGILSPLSFIPCPFLGLMADKVGMIWVLTLLNSVGSIMFVCLVIGDHIALQWIAVIGSTVLLSFLASQNYCYIAGAYPTSLQGKLAGTAMLVGGTLSFVNMPLYDIGVNTGFRGVNIGFLALSGLNFALLWFMWAKTKVSHSKRDKPPAVATPPTAAPQDREPGLLL